MVIIYLLVIETTASEKYKIMPRKHHRSRAVREKWVALTESGPTSYELLQSCARRISLPCLICLNGRMTHRHVHMGGRTLSMPVRMRGTPTSRLLYTSPE